MKKIFLNVAIFVLSLALGLTMASGQEKFAYEEAQTFAEAKMAYHLEMNTFFNDKIEKTLKILKEQNWSENPNFKAPECQETNNATECKKKCSPENISTYCVSVEALDRHLKYLAKLNAFKGEINSLIKENDNYGSVVDLSLARAGAMDAEAEQARRALDGTLNAFEEFKTAYPLHKKYQEIMKNLLIYQSRLRDLRREVMRFPLKFNNVTSKTCQ